MEQCCCPTRVVVVVGCVGVVDAVSVAVAYNCVAARRIRPIIVYLRCSAASRVSPPLSFGEGNLVGLGQKSIG